MQQKFAAVPVGGWPVWGAAEMSCLPKEVLNVPCVFFSFFLFVEHASIDLLVWHAKDFRKKPFSESRSLAKAVEFCDRSPAFALHLHFSSLRHGDYRSREDKPKSRIEEETAGLA